VDCFRTVIVYTFFDYFAMLKASRAEVSVRVNVRAAAIRVISDFKVV
jgi:hypothetical protein